MSTALAAWGLTPAEAALYLALAREGPATAGALTRSQGNSRGRTYAYLAELANGGFVQVGSTRPRVYTAVPPAEVVARFLRIAQEAAAAGTPAAHGPAPSLPSAPQRPRIRIISGRTAVVHEKTRLVAESAQALVGFASRAEAQRLLRSPGLLARIQHAKDRGVSVRLWFGGESPRALPLEALRGIIGDDTLRFVPTGRPAGFQVLANESGALLCWPCPDDADPLHGSDIGIRIDDPATGQTWLRGADCIEAAFGRDRPENRSRGLAVALQLVEDVEKATMEVALLAEPGFAGALRDLSGTLPRITQALAARGVLTRVLVEAAAGTRAARTVGDGIEARVAHRLSMEGILIDRTRLYQAISDPDPSRPPFLRVSDDPLEVAFHQAWFDATWERTAPSPLRMRETPLAGAR